MTDNEAFTLKQLAQMALGGNKLDNLHISLLHTIINFTLKKLSCENEKVKLNGLPADNLRKLLQQSTTGPALSIDEQNVQTPLKQYENITKLEEKMKIIESQVDKHLAEVKFSLTSDAPCWTDYEDEESPDETLNGLRHNKWFLKELHRVLTMPFICRLRTTELNLVKLNDRIEVFKKEWASAYEKMNVVGKLQESLADLRKIINKERSVFITSMSEIQGLLNSKVNNCEMLPIKANFQEMINEITQRANEFEKSIKTSRASVFYTEINTENIGISHQQKSPEQLKRISAKNVCDCNYTPVANRVPLPELLKSITSSQVLWEERPTKCRLSIEK